MDVRLRNGLITAGGAVAIFALVRFGLGVPNGNILLSLYPAYAAGLAAVALVLMYRTSRIINFAQIALGALSAQLFYAFYAQEKLLPYGAALIVALLAGVAVAVIIGTIASMLFFKHPRLVMTVVTILFIQLIAEVQGRVNGIFIDPGEVQQRETILGPFTWFVEIDSIPFRFGHFFGLFMLVAFTIGLVVFFRRTRFGTAIRASAENADRASLLGINVRLLNVAVWALAGIIASVGQLSIITVEPYEPTAFFDQTALLLPLTAAVVARMRSMPVAFLIAFGMVVLDRGIGFKVGGSALIQLGIFGVLMLALILQRKQLSVREREATSWKATKEIRPTPRELLELPVIRRTRLGLMAGLAVIALGIPWLFDQTTVSGLALIWISGFIGLSLVILTGWSGQISLGQWAIVTVGAFVGANASVRMGMPFLISLLIGGLAGVIFALLIGLPALRIRGLFLAVTTFGIAVVLPLLVFGQKFLGPWAPEKDVPRPRLFISFADERYFYYLAVALFLVGAASVTALRRSRGGRVLIALRDNEDGVRAFGVNATRTRLTAFAISGFIAGVGGAFLVHHNLGMEQGGYNFQQSVIAFIAAVVGGVSSVMGPLTAALIYYIVGAFIPGLFSLLTGVGALVILMFIPGGFIQIVFGIRDGILRVVAMRQHIVVPSLFADYSPEAWERRLAPLSQPVQSHGLAALRHDQRYALPSRIFGGAAQ